MTNTIVKTFSFKEEIEVIEWVFETVAEAEEFMIQVWDKYDDIQIKEEAQC